MIETYSQKAVTSFYLWFEHTLLNVGQAFQTTSGALYPTPDARFDQNYWRQWGSPRQQWVYDESVMNAYIPRDVTVNNIVTPSSTGVHIDYNHGRVIFNYPATNPTSVSIQYSWKEFNTYLVNSDSATLQFETSPFMDPRFNKITAPSGANPSTYIAPACLIMNTNSENKPFAFGGMQNTETKMRVIVAADNAYKMDFITSVFRDMAEVIIPLIPLAENPLDEFGDFKSGVYNYGNIAATHSDRYMFLDKVTIVKMGTNQQMKAYPGLTFAALDFYLSDPRYPKLEIPV